MAKLNISLTTANALYQYAQRVTNREIDVGNDLAAFVELRAALDHVCSTVTDWTPGKSNNLFISGPGWMVSYKIASDTGEPETALLDRDEHRYFILPGDHRVAYQAAAPGGWEALYQVYKEREAASKSDDGNYMFEFRSRGDNTWYGSPHPPRPLQEAIALVERLNAEDKTIEYRYVPWDGK